jgi:diguanylate cyclase (GGDEF)-like protein
LEQLKFFRDVHFNINDIHLFHNIPPESITKISAHLNTCPVLLAKAGDIVLDSHSNGNNLYVILKGTLALTSNITKRQLENATTQFFAGECVGEISVLDEEAHSATIAAVTDTELLAISASIVWKLIDESNGVARNLLQLLSFRIRAANAQLRNRQKVGEFYRQLSMVDGLTGLNNRSWLNSQLPGLIDNAHTTGDDLSIIMVDLDNFKKFNDLHGHVLGDEALQAAAKMIGAGLRPTDFAARYGGEEIIIILPNTSRDAGLVVAERLCERIRHTRIFEDENKSLPHITASFGLATLAEDQDGLGLIASADAALYRAKGRGRNQVAL